MMWVEERKGMAKERESEGGGRKMERCGRRREGVWGGDGTFANEPLLRAESLN